MWIAVRGTVLVLVEGGGLEHLQGVGTLGIGLEYKQPGSQYGSINTSRPIDDIVKIAFTTTW
jgi:hypothetical protein